MMCSNLLVSTVSFNMKALIRLLLQDMEIEHEFLKKD